MSQPQRYVAYYRMRSVGYPIRTGTLERQKQSVRRFLDATDHDLVGEFTEVMRPAQESDTSPAFDLALQCCLSFDAILVAALHEIALGNASRAQATREGVEILLIDTEDGEMADDPANAGTDDAPYLDLNVAKRRQVPLQTDRTPRPPVGNREKADRFARAILPVIEQIKATGATTLTDIADELNARHIRTARGRQWYPTTVRNILRRAPEK